MKNPHGRPPELVALTEPGPVDRTPPAMSPSDAKRGQMTVTGRVLDPAGQPAAGVAVDVIGRARAPEVGSDVPASPYDLLGHGVTDGDGRYHVVTSRTSTASFYEVYVLAAGAGTGLNCAPINPDATQPTAEVRLQRPRIIRGRLVDVNGQPAVGVEVHIQLYARGQGDTDFVGLPWAGPLAGIPAWPKPITTDAQGRFAFAGIGRGLVYLQVRDPRFACQRFELADNARN